MTCTSELCRCGSGKPRRELYDGRRIFLRYVCDACVARVRAEYRPEIFRYYTRADVDEPIEPDDY